MALPRTTRVGNQVALPLAGTAPVAPVFVLSPGVRTAAKTGGGAVLAVAALVGGYLVVSGKVKIPGFGGTVQASGGGTPIAPPITGPDLTGLVQAAAWSIVSVTPGIAKVGSRLTATVLLQNSGNAGGASDVSGVVVDPDGKVAGHFQAVRSGAVPAGSTSPLVLSSLDNLATLYGGTSIRLGFVAGAGLASLAIGAPAPTATYATVDVPAVYVPAPTVNPSPTQPLVIPTAAQSTAAPTPAQPVAPPPSQPAAPLTVSADQLVQIGYTSANPYVKQLASTYLNPTVTTPLGVQVTAQAQSAGVGDLVSQYNALGTEITKLRALVGLQQQTGQQLQPVTYNGHTYTSATDAWNALAAQQSQVDQDIGTRINARVASGPQPSSPSQPSPTQAVSAGTVLQPYASNQTVVASGQTQVQSAPPSSYQGSTTYTPTTSGGIFIHGVGGTGFYAPPGSSAYNALVGGGG